MRRLLKGPMFGRTRVLLALCGTAPLSCAYDYTGPAGPRAEIDVTQLSFTSDVDTASITLSNTGESPLHWNILNTIDWLSAPDSGIVPGGGTAKLLFRSNAEPMSAGDYDGALTISANHFGPPMAIGVHLQVAPAPIATVVSASTPLEYPVDAGQILITNSGKGLLHWNAHSTATWLTLERGFNDDVSGAIAPHDTSVIAFRIDRDAAPNDTTAHIVIESDDENSPLLVQVDVQGVPAPSYLALPGPVVDAVLGSNDTVQALIGTTLSVIIPMEGTIIPIALARPGISVETLPGTTIVAHDSAFSVVDMSTLTVERFVPLDFQVQAMTAVAGFVRLVPKDASRAHIVSIAINDPDHRRDSATDHPPLHDIEALGTSLYGAYDGGILGYDLDHESLPTVHSDWTGIPFAPHRIDMWLGPFYRIITSSGAIFQLGSGTVTGTLAWPGGPPAPPIRHVRDLWDIVLVVHEMDRQPPSEHVWDYATDTMTPAAVDLPHVEVGGLMAPAVAHFYLSNGGRSRLIIQQAVTGDGAGPWALVRLYH